MDAALARIVRLISGETGLALEGSRAVDTENAIRQAMRAAELDDPERYLQRLAARASEREKLIAELTVGETYFFREPQHFELLRAELDARGRLSVWSAGCASGEEPYSVAIVLEESGREGTILASDISRPALARAAEASYRAWSLRGVDPAITARWFRASADRFELDARIKSRVTFEHFNLARAVYPPRPVDVILCRNVFLYFQPEATRAVAHRLAECLTPSGVLMTGPSDPPLFDEPLLTSVLDSSMLYYRRR